jgi:CPA2 family monovalent cation:H+ antiporter-2
VETLLREIVVIFGLSIAILFICHRFAVPTIIGFLLTGAVAGPHGLALVRAVHEVEILAEIGVVLLLFTIGLEFSLADLLRIKRSVLIGGSLQVLLTILVIFALVRQAGTPPGTSIFIGFLVSLSSTAIVLKLLQERGEIDSPHGRTALAILIFQDVIIVPMILLTPLLTGSTGDANVVFLFPLAKGLIIVLAVLVSAQRIVPWLLYQIAQTRSRELFLLSIVTMCSAVAWLTSSLGLSLALGAFLAGLIISESEYSHQALGNVIPFRDLFTSFFFVSVGMLLDVGFVLQQPLRIALMTLGVLILKTIMAGLATLLLGFPLRIVILTGLGLSQVGEFSFILSQTGLQYDLFAGDVYQFFLSVSVLTMAATPFIVALAPHIADRTSGLPVPRKLKSGLYPISGMDDVGGELRLQDHLLIIGFGINGRNVAGAAKMAGIPHVIIEMNPDTVRQERSHGEPIHYGDATQEVVLEHAGIEKARVIAIVIADPAATRRIAVVARRLNPSIYMIARTRFVQEVEALYRLGADEVIPEEFETSVEIFARVLAQYEVPGYEIQRFVTEARAHGYELFRNLSEEENESLF